MRPSEEDRSAMTPMDFHRRYGPRFLKMDGAQSYVVPIKPEFHALLFPDAEEQLSLSAGAHPFGNSIRKAYLCHAQVRQVQPGDVLLFYRSHQGQGVRIVGVAEDTLVSDNAATIARFVGTRTVYSYKQIQEMAAKPVLVILFRQARILTPAVPLKDLRSNGVVRGVPQSIVAAQEEARPYLTRLLGWSEG